jgi:hypothetical protein
VIPNKTFIPVNGGFSDYGIVFLALADKQRIADVLEELEPVNITKQRLVFGIRNYIKCGRLIRLYTAY